MNKGYLIGAIALSGFILFCGGGNDGRRDATSVGADGWIYEGWACAPDAAEALKGNSPAQYCQKSGSKDYLYMKFDAAAEQSTIERAGAEGVQMRRSTCRKAAKDQASSDGLAKIIGEYLEQASGVKNGQSTGQVIIAHNAGLIRGVGIYNCCSINENGHCAAAGEKEEWKGCQCVAYMKYPGGQKGFEASAEKAAAEANP